jgi:hypothetical protein
METYLPTPFDFLNWKEIEKSFLKKKPLKYPKCVEINITKRNNYENQWEDELDIFTIERVLKELKKAETEWLVLGNKYDIFLHKRINKFFKILSDLNLNVYSLKTDCLYIDRVNLNYIFNIVKENFFIKKKKGMKEFENEIFKENLEKIISFKTKNDFLKPKILLFEEDFNQKEISEIEKKGFYFLKNFSYCLKEIKPFLPFFFLSIENNGFCYSEGEKNPVSTIFFNSIKKIWNSKGLKKIRKNKKEENLFIFEKDKKMA